MLVSFSLSNFKSFRKLDPIELKPLTVLCGTNNSGKSTLLQSLLLMKQSNIAPRRLSLGANLQEPLLLNGPYASLGDWADVIRGHATEEEMGFSWKITGEVGEEMADFPETIDAEIDVMLKKSNNNTSSQLMKVKKFVFRKKKTRLIEINNLIDNKYCLKIWDITFDELWEIWLYDSLVYSWLYEYEKYSDVNVETVVKYVLFDSPIKNIVFEKVIIEFDGIWPTFAILKSDLAKPIYDAFQQVQRNLNKHDRKTELESEALNLLDYLIKKLTDLINIDNLDPKKRPDILERRQDVSLADFYIYYNFTAKLLHNFWSRLRYLGPVREAPHRYYFLNDMSGIEMGNKGEEMPLVLGIEKDEIVPSYYRCIYQGKQVEEYELRESDSLLEAVNWWLSEGMNLPKISEIGGSRGVPHQVKLRSSGIEVSLSDVGLGINQVLPVLVECLRSQPGDTIIIEQPGIHLHPSLQSRLADFLICMAKSGKNLVVETHSEYLMNRFFLRIAQEDGDEIRKLFNPLFVSYDEGEQTSVVQPISINEFGEIENWPVGFFDQNDARELMAATLKKRTSKSKR